MVLRPQFSAIASAPASDSLGCFSAHSHNAQRRLDRLARRREGVFAAVAGARGRGSRDQPEALQPPQLIDEHLARDPREGHAAAG